MWITSITVYQNHPARPEDRKLGQKSGFVDSWQKIGHNFRTIGLAEWFWYTVEVTLAVKEFSKFSHS